MLFLEEFNQFFAHAKGNSVVEYKVDCAENDYYNCFASYVIEVEFFN